MEHHEFFVSTLFNRYLFNPIAEALGYQVDHDVLPAHLVMILLIGVGLTLFAALLRRRLSAENPSHIQQALEIVVGGIRDLMDDVIGPGSRRFFPLIGTLFFYILVGNMLGLIPGFMSPTSNFNITGRPAPSSFSSTTTIRGFGCMDSANTWLILRALHW